jgi:hypothetical protein
VGCAPAQVYYWCKQLGKPNVQTPELESADAEPRNMHFGGAEYA